MPKSVQPPEEHQVTETADTSSNWRKRDKGKEKEVNSELEVVSLKNDGPEEVESEEGKDREKSVRFDKQLDDYSSEEESSPMPFIKLKDIDGTSKTESRKWTKKKRERAEEDRQERAYRLVSRFDDPKIVEHMMEKVSNTELEGVTIGKMIALSPEFAKSMRGILTKTRAPIKQSLVSEISIPPSAFPYMEDIHSLERDAIDINDLPKVDSLYIATEEDVGTVAGSIICQDPVLQYLATLPDTEQPRQLYAGVMSAPLRTLRPRCAGKEWIESVVDGGSQIVSMALNTAERLSLTWDPSIKIVMQSANGQLKTSAGLARNVPFEFDEIIVYLQVHIIDQDAYEILLGRPFEILTELQVSNKRDGSQTITLSDPGSSKKCTMPTYVRGTFSIKETTRALVKQPEKPKRKVTIEEVQDKDDRDYEERYDSDDEGTPDSEGQDFRKSSRS
jgi:hypothetical protein